MEDEFESIIRNYSSLIAASIERIVPKSFSLDSLSMICGKTEYDYEPSSISSTISEPFWNLLDRGGKRWRPALFLLTYEALGGDSAEVADISVVPEIVHNGTLIVDDVEDDSEFRRGRECIHRIYGLDIAINAGNTMYYLPLHAILSSSLEQEKKFELLNIYVEEMINLSFGQAMDIAWHRGLVSDLTEANYLQMCSFKTGSLSRMAVKMAAVLRDSGTRQYDALSKFAESLGVAFQIQDDILNITGDAAKYGKEIGGDITEGKRSLMVIYALRKLDPREAKVLREILLSHTRDTEKINHAISLIKSCGAVDYAIRVSQKLVAKSWEAITHVLPPSEAREKIGVFANFLIVRSF